MQEKTKLLSVTKREAFFRFISPEHLYFCAMVFGIITAGVVAMIYIFLHVKKKRFLIKQHIVAQLNDWISDMLTMQSFEEIIIPTDLQQYLIKPRNRQFVIENLINIKKNLTGIAAEHIIKLYEHVGLKKDSIKSFNSMVWHEKAKGIYQLYMMNQKNEMPDIFNHTDSGNEYVRMEAQTAIIGFKGFEGLSFLDTLTRPLNEWQQIKLLEQLSSLNPGSFENLPKWLRSDNLYVVQFALKLTDIYLQFQVKDIVVQCLKNEHDKIRYQAIKTLGKIADSDTSEILKQQYHKETTGNKIAMLKQLALIGTDGDMPFLTGLLQETDERIKLETARAIARIGNNGWQTLKENAQNNEVLMAIGKQVKYELGV